MKSYMMETLISRLSPEEMSNHIWDKMTVDMFVDRWQVKHSSIEAVVLIMDTQTENLDYWSEVKSILEKKAA